MRPFSGRLWPYEDLIEFLPNEKSSWRRLARGSQGRHRLVAGGVSELGVAPKRFQQVGVPGAVTPMRTKPGTSGGLFAAASPAGCLGSLPYRGPVKLESAPSWLNSALSS